MKEGVTEMEAKKIEEKDKKMNGMDGNVQEGVDKPRGDMISS